MSKEYTLVVSVEHMPAILIALRRFKEDISRGMHLGQPIASDGALAMVDELCTSLKRQRDAQAQAFIAHWEG